MEENQGEVQGGGGAAPRGESNLTPDNSNLRGSSSTVDMRGGLSRNYDELNSTTHLTRESLKRKRELKLEAVRKRFLSESKMLEEKRQLEMQLIEEEFNANLESLEEEESLREGPTGRQTNRETNSVNEWINRGRYGDDGSSWLDDGNRSELGHSRMHNNTMLSNSLREFAQEISRSIRESRGGETLEKTSQGIIKKMSVGKALPTFDGDVLEWPMFKRAFEESTSKVGYTEQENLIRLNESLKGDAKEAVASLMVTANDTKQIMQLLQLRFGNSNAVGTRIIKNLKDLPTIQGINKDFINFATKVKNCVAALEATKHLGYLHSLELVREVMSKMPSSMVYNFNRHRHSSNETDVPMLVSLSNFLFFEAEIACKVGVLENVEMFETKKRTDNSESKDQNPKRSRGNFSDSQRSFYRASERLHATTEKTIIKQNCGYCRSKDHSVVECPQFGKLTISKRWDWASQKKMCFRCLLSTEHRQNKCRESSCTASGCKRNHHTLLHRMNKSNDDEEVSIIRDEALKSREEKESEQ